MSVLVAILVFLTGTLFGIFICGLLHFSRGNFDEMQSNEPTINVES